MDARFELFDHTADLGVRVYAPTLPEIVRLAGEALYAAIGELEPEGDPRAESFAFAGADAPTLLRDYVAELLLVFERDHRMLTRVDVHAFEPGRLEASGESRAVSRSKSLFDREVKAITYHGLRIDETDGGYVAEYIVDI